MNRTPHAPSLMLSLTRIAAMVALPAVAALSTATLAQTPAATAAAAPASTTTSTPAAANPTATPVATRAPQVGDATRALLAHQANGVSASPVPRPIPGDIAQRSYQRYLKSFEYAIPESFTRAVEQNGTSSSR
ncbi:MAG: DUF3613 domain-containing protein [Polaromonas sp.]|nr:DUF3613 domain-containing protein [Polaromonas sp.]